MVELSQHKTMGTAWLRIANSLVIIAVALYIVFCFSPLRLHYDSIRYYAIKDCIELGCPPDSDAAKDFFPFGYTALLLILSKFGILNSFTVVFANVLFLFGALTLLYKVFEKRIHFSFLLVLVLFNWLFVKFVTHPLSEMQYLFFSMACIYFFWRFTQLKKISFLLLAVLFSWLALQTRTVGISLVAGIGAGLLWEFRDKLLLFLKRYKIFVAAVVLGLIGAVAVFAEQLGLRHYLGVFSTHSSDAPLLTRLGWHFTEWGEVLSNMPSGKAVQKLPAQIGSFLFILVGVIFFIWFCFVLFGKKNSIPFFIKAYLFFYIVILFNWPFADPRFWVPVLPITAVGGGRTTGSIAGPTRRPRCAGWSGWTGPGATG
ncbi:MAG: hypothetical protein EOO03_11440 [Chitinophagaceae bacterium]|nr:MAG: hypothetical protein EOO03_11440 [Chitinophagaceae bacterium]